MGYFEKSYDHAEFLLLQHQLIKIPTLLIAGKLDGAIHYDSIGIDEDPALMKKLVMLEGASHFLHHEMPTKFNEILGEWIEST